MSFHNPDADIAGAILTIDLDALVANWRLLASKHPKGRSAAVVKANAYGLGIRPVGEALYDAGCRVFFVAHPNEGVRLRKVLADVSEKPEIHILNGLAAPSPLYLDHDLTPVLNSYPQIESWAKISQDAGKLLAADIHVDTGMSRLGLDKTELDQLAQNTDIAKAFKPRFLMTHLASADRPDHPINAAQLRLMHEAQSKLAAIGFDGVSIANSSGVFLGPDYLGDILRPGLAIYGANPTPDAPNPMAQVVRLQAKILQTRRIDSPETVGYGATFQANKTMRVATLAVGYADGFLRSASGGLSGYQHLAFYKDKPVPILGRISMDLIGVDVTDLAPQDCQEGCLIDLIGPHNTVDDLARAAGTIGYEVLTSLGARYHRRYMGGPTSQGATTTS